MDIRNNISGDYFNSPSIYSTHSKKFFIRKSLLNKLKEHGLSSPDREVCGLITGIDDEYYEATKYHPITNVSTNDLGYDDYKMDPQESMDILINTQVIPTGPHKTDLVAIFHTHPHSTPFPSSIDIKYAAYNTVYIIYSVVFNKFSFQYWNGEWFVPVEVEVV